MARLRAPYGSISKTKNGVTRVRFWGDKHDGKGYRRLSKSIRGNRRDAQMFLSQMQLAHNEDKPTMTVGDVYQQWYLPDIKDRLAESTINVYGYNWNAYVKERWANVSIADIKPIEVQKWLDGLTFVQAQKALVIMQPLMDYPVRYEMIPTNPMRINYVMPSQEAHSDKGIYTLAECQEMAQVIENHLLEPAYLFAAFGSCRTGEALGIDIADVTFETAENGMFCAVALIKQQVNNAGQIIERTKNTASERYAIVPEPYSYRLKEICETKQSGLLTCDTFGMPLTRVRMCRLWKDVCKHTNIGYHPFKNLRNSWRTYTEWELDGEPEKLEKLMGHKGQSVTARHYNRPQKEMYVNFAADIFETMGHLGT